MDRQKHIAALAENQEDQLLLSQIWDRFSSGVRRNIPTATAFLSGREQILAERLVTRAHLGEPVFFGGVPSAERKVLCHVPDYYEPQEYLMSEDGPVSALRVSFSAYDTLNHRDFLGSLMGQGIKRQVLGDIFPGEHSCDILVLREMADYLSRELTHVGRAKVETQEIALLEISVPEQKVKVITDTVATLRLDSVMASGFQLGRSKAATYINGGKTEVNHIPVEKPDAMVSEGDVISARGLGKIRVKTVKGQTKKGRTALVLEKYL